MALTPGQSASLKAFILATPALAAQPNNSDGNSAIAEALNLPAAPDFWVLRTSLSRSELTSVTSVDVDGSTQRAFQWNAAGYIGRTQGERDAFREIFNHVGEVNPSRPNVRAAFVDIFSGGGATNNTHFLNLARRRATVLEKVLHVPAANAGLIGTPALMTHEGPIPYQDVETARNLP